jgi:HPt (histidine-containing phosphotransfer) domain-containing protein
MQEEREACLAAGMDDYLPKPIHLQELAAALRRCRPRAAPRPQAAPSDAVLHPPALERLMQTVGDDRGLLATLIDTFLREVPRLVDGARQALRQGRADEVRRAAHTLKSNGATFGATRLAELSRELEALARSGTLEGTAELLARIEEEYESVRIALETMRERGRP